MPIGHKVTVDRLSGLIGVLAGVWMPLHFEYGFWGWVMSGLLLLPGMVVLVSSDAVSVAINRILAPIDTDGAVARHLNAVLNPIQNIANRINDTHRQAAFKVFGLGLAISLSVLTLVLVLLALFMAAISSNQFKDHQASSKDITGTTGTNQQEVIEIEIQYEGTHVWQPRGSCFNDDQDISRVLQHTLEQASVYRARAIGRDSRRVYDSLQK